MIKSKILLILSDFFNTKKKYYNYSFTFYLFRAYVTKSISQSFFVLCDDSDSNETFHKILGVSVLMLLAYVNIAQLKLALKFQV